MFLSLTHIDEIQRCSGGECLLHHRFRRLTVGPAAPAAIRKCRQLSCPPGPFRFAISRCPAYIQSMPRKPTELHAGIARAFAEDMRAFFAERDAITRDEIAARQLHALKRYRPGKLPLYDVKEMFLRMKEHA